MEDKYREAIIILMKNAGYLWCKNCSKWIHKDNISYGYACDNCGKDILKDN